MFGQCFNYSVCYKLFFWESDSVYIYVYILLEKVLYDVNYCYCHYYSYSCLKIKQIDICDHCYLRIG